MNAPIDTLGFAHEQARVPAPAFGQAQEQSRDGLVTRDHLDARPAEMEGRLGKQLSELKVELVREVATVGKDVNGRLWSTATIIAGLSTAISATVGAPVALVPKHGGL